MREFIYILPLDSSIEGTRLYVSRYEINSEMNDICFVGYLWKGNSSSKKTHKHKIFTSKKGDYIEWNGRRKYLGQPTKVRDLEQEKQEFWSTIAKDTEYLERIKEHDVELYEKTLRIFKSCGIEYTESNEVQCEGRC